MGAQLRCDSHTQFFLASRTAGEQMDTKKYFMDSWPNNGRETVWNQGQSFGRVQQERQGSTEEYEKEMLRQTMLKQEQMFKEQVHELHRLYKVQKILMNDLREKDRTTEVKSPNNAFVFEVQSESSKSKESQSKSTDYSYQMSCSKSHLNSFSASTSLQHMFSANEMNSGVKYPNGLQLHKPSCIKFDLERPADEYIEDEVTNKMECITEEKEASNQDNVLSVAHPSFEHESELQLTLSTGSNRDKTADTKKLESHIDSNFYKQNREEIQMSNSSKTRSEVPHFLLHSGRSEVPLQEFPPRKKLDSSDKAFLGGIFGTFPDGQKGVDCRSKCQSLNKPKESTENQIFVNEAGSGTINGNNLSKGFIGQNLINPFQQVHCRPVVSGIFPESNMSRSFTSDQRGWERFLSNQASFPIMLMRSSMPRLASDTSLESSTGTFFDPHQEVSPQGVPLSKLFTNTGNFSMSPGFQSEVQSAAKTASPKKPDFIYSSSVHNGHHYYAKAVDAVQFNNELSKARTRQPQECISTSSNCWNFDLNSNSMVSMPTSGKAQTQLNKQLESLCSSSSGFSTTDKYSGSGLPICRAQGTLLLHDIDEIPVKRDYYDPQQETKAVDLTFHLSHVKEISNNSSVFRQMNYSSQKDIGNVNGIREHLHQLSDPNEAEARAIFSTEIKSENPLQGFDFLKKSYSIEKNYHPEKVIGSDAREPQVPWFLVPCNSASVVHREFDSTNIEDPGFVQEENHCQRKENFEKESIYNRSILANQYCSSDFLKYTDKMQAMRELDINKVPEGEICNMDDKEQEISFVAGRETDCHSICPKTPQEGMEENQIDINMPPFSSQHSDQDHYARQSVIEDLNLPPEEPTSSHSESKEQIVNLQPEEPPSHSESKEQIVNSTENANISKLFVQDFSVETEMLEENCKELGCDNKEDKCFVKASSSSDLQEDTSPNGIRDNMMSDLDKNVNEVVKDVNEVSDSTCIEKKGEKVNGSTCIEKKGEEANGANSSATTSSQCSHHIAEILMSIATKENFGCLENINFQSSDALCRKTSLEWLANVIPEYSDSLPARDGYFSRSPTPVSDNQRNAFYEDTKPEESVESYEALALKMEECADGDSSKPYSLEHKTIEHSTCYSNGILKRPKRGNYQNVLDKDNLLSISTLSRQEISEDMQNIFAIIKSTGGSTFGGFDKGSRDSATGDDWLSLPKRRRSRSWSNSKVARFLIDEMDSSKALKKDSTMLDEVTFSGKWEKPTRKRRMHRHTCEVFSVSKLAY